MKSDQYDTIRQKNSNQINSKFIKIKSESKKARDASDRIVSYPNVVTHLIPLYTQNIT